MIEKLFKYLGYSTLYFISYTGRSGVYGSMNMTVKPYITINNYEDVIKEVVRLADEEVAVTCISKL